MPGNQLFRGSFLRGKQQETALFGLAAQPGPVPATFPASGGVLAIWCSIPKAASAARKSCPCSGLRSGGGARRSWSMWMRSWPNDPSWPGSCSMPSTSVSCRISSPWMRTAASPAATYLLRGRNNCLSLCTMSARKKRQIPNVDPDFLEKQKAALVRTHRQVRKR